MSLIQTSPDLKTLRDEGYEVEVRGAHLLIHSVPYLNSARSIGYGTLVSPLTVSGNRAAQPNNHVVFFIGDQPCNKDGSEIEALKHGMNAQVLAEGLTVNRSFSNKPQGGFADFHAKMTSYINVISAPVRSMNPEIDARTFRVIETEESNSVFNYPDTNSSRANISAISQRLSDLRIGIVGLGGTGSYVLDFVAKCPVKEIHLFDGDKFLAHNAFRAPGAPDLETLNLTLPKTEYLKQVYSRMHKGIVDFPDYIDEGNLHVFDGLDFVFICMDKGGVKKYIVDRLQSLGKPFIDVGIGVNVPQDGALTGMIRTTTSTVEHQDHVAARVSMSDNDEDKAYSTNIQIAELNALNASFAVIRWKKLYGFYEDAEHEMNSVYLIGANSVICDATVEA
ncbi:MAG: ThiF family adenylyltransferase [Flavobacteriales bacterium]|nr:ThiF family adenylyltransferase [Flavobacteriales bacterium]